MHPGPESARASALLGRFLVGTGAGRGVPRGLTALALLVLGCASGARTPDEAPVRIDTTLPAVQEGPSSPAAEADASRLLARSRLSLATDSPAAARAGADSVLSRYPTVVGSSEALWIRARAAMETGDRNVAAEAAGRFRELLPEGHELRLPARVLEGRALASVGRSLDAVEVLLPLPGDAAEDRRSSALEVIRGAVVELRLPTLEALTGGEAPGWPRLRAPILAELGLAYHVRGREEEAAEAARSALALSGEGPEARLARSVLADDVTVERRRAVRLGGVLPRTGSPGAREYATLIEEGVRTRIEVDDRTGAVPVEWSLQGSAGDSTDAAEVVRRLTSDGVAGLVGPLSDRAVEAAARARQRPIPLISPTARNVPADAPGVYSLGGPDPGAPRLLARYAADRSLTEAVVVHPRSPTSTFEARSFAEEFQRLGGRVLEVLDYSTESTFFEDLLGAVRELQPAALVLPIPAGDVELLAPQVTYFGLDTLGIQILGTSEWVRPEALDAVEPRHTDGVVVATPRRPGRATEAQERFVEEYERLFQKTLRSRGPALGYDAAGLLLEAFRSGARSPEEVRAALEQIREFQGATGTISIRDGRVVRDHHLVRLRNREMIPIRTDFDEGSGPP